MTRFVCGRVRCVTRGPVSSSHLKTPPRPGALTCTIGTEVVFRRDTQDPVLTETERERAPRGPSVQGLRPSVARSRCWRRGLPPLDAHTDEKAPVALRERLGRKVRWRFPVTCRTLSHPVLEGGRPIPPLSQPEGILG
uniref:Uncharacterized protein n=1 Tax=Rousettus aegyptiacus TaxID=9407 RepID=A0A7J8IM57_ROUAE|nr:hypothetical protein HJG63_010486 [Rousettus aegyptiacus]